MRAWIRATAIAVSIAGTAGSIGTSAQSRGRTIVTVVDDDNRPVIGLDSEDFSLRDGAVRRAVLDAERATEPLSIVIVLAGWTPADLPDVRRAVSAFTRAIETSSATHEIALLRTDGASARYAAPLSSRAATFDADVDRSASAGSGALLDAVIDASGALKRSSADRRAIVLIARRGAADGAAKARYELMDALVDARASLWTVELSDAPVKGAVTDLIGAGADTGGALRTAVAVRSEVGAALTRLADLLLSQYVVTYVWPDPMLSQLTIATRHSRGQVLAPVW